MTRLQRQSEDNIDPMKKNTENISDVGKKVSLEVNAGQN
jgi:hypothetical protein